MPCKHLLPALRTHCLALILGQLNSRPRVVIDEVPTRSCPARAKSRVDIAQSILAIHHSEVSALNYLEQLIEFMDVGLVTQYSNKIQSSNRFDQRSGYQPQSKESYTSISR